MPSSLLKKVVRTFDLNQNIQKSKPRGVIVERLKYPLLAERGYLYSLLIKNDANQENG